MKYLCSNWNEAFRGRNSTIGIIAFSTPRVKNILQTKKFENIKLI